MSQKSRRGGAGTSWLDGSEPLSLRPTPAALSGAWKRPSLGHCAPHWRLFVAAAVAWGWRVARWAADRPGTRRYDRGEENTCTSVESDCAICAYCKYSTQHFPPHPPFFLNIFFKYFFFFASVHRGAGCLTAAGSGYVMAFLVRELANTVDAFTFFQSSVGWVFSFCSRA